MEAHAVLGVPKDASEEQFRRAYKALARIWHPDRQLDNSEEATAKFVEINKAYKTMARNLRRSRRAAEGATNTPESSVSGSPPATPESFSSSLPEESTRSSTSRPNSPTPNPRTSQFTSPYSSTSSEHPSPSSSFPGDSNAGPQERGRSSSRSNVHLPEDPSSADMPHHYDNYNHSAAGSSSSSPSSSHKPPRTRLRKQSKVRNCRPDPLTGDYTPKASRRPPASASASADSFHVEHDRVPDLVVGETLYPLRSILRGAGADAPKRWVHVLNMTLEEIYLGKTFHFRVVRYRRNGKKSVVPLEVHVPPGSRGGTEIVVEDAGNERKDGSWQAVVFQVKEVKHERFRRVHDDLLLEVRLPWVDSLNDEVGEVYLQGVDGLDHVFKVDYRRHHLLSGTTVIPGAGMPSRSGVGRGRIVVRWEISSPSSSWGALKHVLRFKG